MKSRATDSALAANEPECCVLIDATTSKGGREQIWHVVQNRLHPATAPIQFEDEAV
jgi:hypothetical protein